MHDFPFYLVLPVTIIFMIMLARKIRVAYPVLLVLAGLGFSIIPGVPVLHIDPELIFVIFLPPLLYEAAWNTSWKELWKWRRIIGSFAFVVVFLTAFSVALVANHFIPGFTLALGFLLGGIVSPPDAVSANSILKFVKVPRRMQSMLEGESLLNDASSLIIFRFALVAVATGQLVWQEAAVSFSWMVAGGIGIGVGIGYLFYRAHRFLHTDANIDFVLTILAPYIMYVVAEELLSSGILAVVSGGLFLSQRHHRFLSSGSRIKAENIWESLSFILNGLVFLIIGLGMPEIVEGLAEVSLRDAIKYSLLVTGVLVVSRILSAYGAVIVTLLARNFIKVADTRNPGWKGPFLLSWSGMRGVVSLAAALSIPVTLPNGEPFPQRSLILFITFVVILLTLVVQGLTLPYFILKFNIPDNDYPITEDESYDLIHADLTKKSIDFIDKHHNDVVTADPTLQKIIAVWRRQAETECQYFHSDRSKEVLSETFSRQREWLHELNKDEHVDDDVIRMHLHRIDLEEERLKFE